MGREGHEHLLRPRDPLAHAHSVADIMRSVRRIPDLADEIIVDSTGARCLRYLGPRYLPVMPLSQSAGCTPRRRSPSEFISRSRWNRPSPRGPALPRTARLDDPGSVLAGAAEGPGPRRAQQRALVHRSGPGRRHRRGAAKARRRRARRAGGRASGVGGSAQPAWSSTGMRTCPGRRHPDTPVTGCWSGPRIRLLGRVVRAGHLRR